MKKTVKAGFGAFVISLFMLMASLLLGEICAFVLKGSAYGQIFTFIFGGISVYLIYTHYSPRFTYEIGEESLKITSKTGRRIKEEEILLTDIGFVGKKPLKATENRRFVKNILSRKDRVYIRTKNASLGILTDAGEEFLIKLKEFEDA